MSSHSRPRPSPWNPRRASWMTALPACLILAATAPAVAETGRTPRQSAAVGYEVPREAPTGDVQVLSFGAADLPVPNLIGTERFVHIRLAAVNRIDDRDWVLDSRDQLLELSDGRRVAPRFARSSAGGAPARIALARGQRGYLDLFFRTDDDPSWTAISWKVRRQQGLIFATTVFARIPAQDSSYSHYRPAEYGGGRLLLGDLWCGPWWADHWLWHHYAGYRRYRYRPLGDGYSVAVGGRRWSYEREHRPIDSGRVETVGTRWRRQSASAEQTAVAAPVTAGVSPAPSHEWSRFRAVAPPAAAAGGGEPLSSRGSSGSPSSSWRPAAGSRPSGSDSVSFSRSWSWSSDGMRSSSSSSSSSSASSSPPSSSGGSPPSSPPPASAPSPSPPPSSSGGESVGSHWRR